MCLEFLIVCKICLCGMWRRLTSFVSKSSSCRGSRKNISVLKQADLFSCLFHCAAFYRVRSSAKYEQNLLYGNWFCPFRLWRMILGEDKRLNGTGFPIQGSRVQNRWVFPRSTQPFIHPRSIKWVTGISGNLVVKSKLLPWSDSSLESVEPHP